MPLDPGHPAPTATVFIPTWNGGVLLEEVLQELEAQETPFPFEILVIDSGSRDGSVERLQRHPVRLIRIPNREFNHGLTRNRAVREARGDVVVLTVQDATPASRDWLATLVAHFEDPQVAGVYTHQIPRPDCSPFLKDRLRSWVPGGGEPEVRQVESPDAFWRRLDHVQRWRVIAFDNVASAVRRSTALELPFPRRRFGEDVTWARQVVLAGYRIVMDPRVAVIHSHKQSIWYEFKRAYLDHQNVNRLVGLRLARRPRDVLESTVAQSRRLFRVVWSDERLGLPARLWWSLKVVPFALTQNLGQYLGPRSNIDRRRGLWRLVDRILGHRV